MSQTLKDWEGIYQRNKGGNGIPDKRFKGMEIEMNMTQDRLQGVGKGNGRWREVSKTLADLTRGWTLSCRTYRTDRKQAAWPDFCPVQILEDVCECTLEEKQDRIQIITETYVINLGKLHLGIYQQVILPKQNLK